MRITNKSNLPEALVNAVMNDPYSKGDADYSVTELLKPPRIKTLESLHKDDLEEDVSDRIWSLYGQIVHSILERSERSGVVEAERRLFATISGVRISGQIDQYERGTIRDFKFITAYKFKNGCPREFEEQLNSYAHLARVNGKKATRLELVGLLRDWSKLEAKRDSSYPQTQVIVVESPIWHEEKALAFLMNRIDIHERAKTNLPECTSEDRWEKPTVWAVMLPGRKTALKLHTSETEALNHSGNLLGSSVVKRPGQNIRCENYCSVSNWCDQFKETQKESK